MNFLLPETQNRTKTGLIVISVLQAMRMIFCESEDQPIKIEDASLVKVDDAISKLETYAKTHRLLIFIGEEGCEEIPFEDGIKTAEAGGYAGVICGRM
jgi:hypothetical protein